MNAPITKSDHNMRHSLRHASGLHGAAIRGARTAEGLARSGCSREAQSVFGRGCGSRQSLQVHHKHLRSQLSSDDDLNLITPFK